MVEYTEQELDDTFAALAHPTRRDLVRRLGQGAATVSELAEPYQVSLAAISKHIQVLEKAGLARREISGRVHTIRLDAAPLQSAAEWLAYQREFWVDSLDALQGLVEGNK